MEGPPDFNDHAEGIGFIAPNVYEGVTHVSIQEPPHNPKRLIVDLCFENADTRRISWDTTISLFVEPTA